MSCMGSTPRFAETDFSLVASLVFGEGSSTYRGKQVDSRVERELFEQCVACRCEDPMELLWSWRMKNTCSSVDGLVWVMDLL